MLSRLLAKVYACVYHFVGNIILWCNRFRIWEGYRRESAPFLRTRWNWRKWHDTPRIITGRDSARGATRCVLSSLSKCRSRNRTSIKVPSRLFWKPSVARKGRDPGIKFQFDPPRTFLLVESLRAFPRTSPPRVVHNVAHIFHRDVTV